jgi:hypothetical protein
MVQSMFDSFLTTEFVHPFQSTLGALKTSSHTFLFVSFLPLSHSPVQGSGDNQINNAFYRLFTSLPFGSLSLDPLSSIADSPE